MLQQCAGEGLAQQSAEGQGLTFHPGPGAHACVRGGGTKGGLGGTEAHIHGSPVSGGEGCICLSGREGARMGNDERGLQRRDFSTHQARA